ncbi:MAG: ATP-binding protein [Muribaculaceae bacterium]|nr:ATP-binding protein [Muribaculaceae bacterium]
MKLIDRKDYLDKIANLIGRNLIVCITGQRRVGKSCLMRTFAAEWSARNDANIIYIDKEKSDFDGIRDYKDLNQYIDSLAVAGKRNIILIDEVQLIDGFERSLCNYYDRDDFDVVVTGSNAKMLSGELATLLSGRYIEVHVYGLSYPEFLTFHNVEDSDASLIRYLNIGGLPNLAMLPIDNADMIRDYLSSVYSTIVLKDILGREQVRNVAFLENLSRFVADNTGKLFSANSISKYMQHERENVSSALVRSYMDFLCNAYILNKVRRYDIHGKQLLTNNEKYYFEDLGLRNALTSGNRAVDIEKLIEGAVYLHLLRLGYNVYVGTLHNGEIDFVANKGDETVYVQATYLLSDESTIKREFGNLMEIKNNYPKYVVSMDPFQAESNLDGIRHLHLRSFLKMERL